MRCICLVLFSFIISIPSLAQDYYPDGETIWWKENKKISISDFRGKPPKRVTRIPYFENLVSNAHCDCKFFIDPSDAEGGGLVSANAIAEFNRTTAYTVYKHQEVVRYMQGYFDICGLYARKLTAYLKEGIQANRINTDDDIKAAVRLYEEKMAEVHRQYANEVTSAKRQREWDAKIAEWLKASRPLYADDGTPLH